MTNDEKQALIRRILNIKTSGKANRFEITELAEIALAALTAQPDDWQQRAEDAEAKLADLEKQEAAGAAWVNCTTRGTDYEFRPTGNIKNGQELFTRPAPAVSLVTVSNCLSFFASVIKSGEAWSSTCERELDASRASSPQNWGGEMKERSIIFNADMVRAVLGGSKTQTRRIIQERHLYRGRGPGNWPAHMPTGQEGEQAIQWLTENSPFGAVGDRLWVRESCFAEHGARTSVDSGSKLVYFPADMSSFEVSPDQVTLWEKLWCYGKGTGGQVVPSIHMPRWASRITLEITGIRVERLQDISEADCAAEGLGSRFLRDYKKPKFAALWQSIYGEESWQANPWVWVIEFKRVEGE